MSVDANMSLKNTVARIYLQQQPQTALHLLRNAGNTSRTQIAPKHNKMNPTCVQAMSNILPHVVEHTGLMSLRSLSRMAVGCTINRSEDTTMASAGP